MARFYHLDRGNILREGQIIDLVKFNDIECQDDFTSKLLQDHFDKLFSNGVCSHGENYFAKSRFMPYLAPFVELMFEYVRKSGFREKPSRAEVLFGLDDIHDFDKLCKLFNLDNTKISIWEVECEEFMKADMFLLDTVQSLIFTNQSILACSKLMNMYWEGKGLNEFIKNETPFWEYLLVPPVKVIRKVEV